MDWFSIAALFFAAAALALAVLVVRGAQEGAIRAHNDAKDLAKTALEMQAKYGGLQMQTASALLERENARVNARVRLINTLRTGEGPAEEAPAPPVGEAPVMGMTGMVDEAHEIERDLHRIRREGVPGEIVRDPGVGEDQYATGSDGTVLHGGKPLEI